MKSPTVLYLLVLFAAARASYFEVASEPKIVQGMLRANLTSLYTEKPCDGSRSTACTGCGSIKICVTSDPAMDEANLRQDCPAITPHCSISTSVTGAVCQKTTDPSVVECAVSFKCIGVGFYANPNSCQVFHYCAGPGATPGNYDCPTGYRFNGKVGACAFSIAACPTFSCKLDNVDSLFQPLPADNQYYVYCAYDKSTTPAKLIDTFVFSCGLGSTYNPSTGRYVFSCPGDGLYVNTANPRQYYQCYILGGRFVYNGLLCDADQQFDAAQNRCIMKAK